VQGGVLNADKLNSYLPLECSKYLTILQGIIGVRCLKIYLG